MGFLGLDLRRSATLRETVLDANPSAVLLRLSDGDLWVDRVLFATGRNGATDKLASTLPASPRTTAASSP